MNITRLTNIGSTSGITYCSNYSKEVDRVENHEKLTNLQERNTRLKVI